jgi:IS5 family transposase
MFKVLILQTQNNLSDERTELYLRDRLTWMRFLGLGLGDPVPDANTIWTFREALTKAGAIEHLFTLFDQALRAAGYLAMSGQLVDASVVAAPKQRNTRAEKQAIEEGRVPEDWPQKPAKLRQKDHHARWTVKTTKAKPREGETPMVDLATPAFGYQNHISADRRHRLIRRWLVTDAATHAGARLDDLLDRTNTAGGAWADTSYRSRKNEAWLRQRMLTSHIHRRKPADRPMPRHVARANARKSAVRAHIEHIFAEQKARMGCSSVRSGWPGQRPRSASPTSSTTCAACSGCNGTRCSPDLTHSPQTRSYRPLHRRGINQTARSPSSPPSP